MNMMFGILLEFYVYVVIDIIGVMFDLVEIIRYFGVLCFMKLKIFVGLKVFSFMLGCRWFSI